MNINENELELLKSFPKQRPILDEEYKKILQDAYINSREGKSLFTKCSLKFEEWMHRKVSQSPILFPVLELGAGTLNHLKFESSPGDYFAVEPQKILYINKPRIKYIKEIYSSINDVPDNLKFSRIISVATLEHITTLPAVVARAATLLNSNGEFRAGIPTEGGFLWYLAWRFGTGLGFFLKYKKSYAPFQQYEHINNSDEIIKVIKIFFKDVYFIRYPFNFKHCSFYTYIHAKNPNIEKAKFYLTDNKIIN